MIYREMAEEDIRQLMHLMHQLQCNQSQFDDLITVKSSSNYLLEATLYAVLENDLQVVYLAIDKEIIAGYIFGWICRERTACSPLENYLYISDAFIIDEYRSKGNYKNLLKLIENWALKNKCANAMFEMYVDNEPIQNIMIKYGYKPYKTQSYKKLSLGGDEHGTDK